MSPASFQRQRSVSKLMTTFYDLQLTPSIKTYSYYEILSTLESQVGFLPFFLKFQNLTVKMLPLIEDLGQKQGSLVIIFSVWKTMLGSAVVSIPWAFQQAGIVSGIATSFVTFIASYYTCSLIMRSVRDDENDYADTVRRYFGNFGYYLTLCSTAALLIGVLVVYFVIQTQLLYPLILAIVSWSTKS